jgi:phenylacetic acid degradation operon negative regulatory protein
MRKPASKLTRVLLRGFHRAKPLRSGSLLITLWGDALAPRGAAVTLGSLIRLAQPLGLNERLVRTSVGRIARRGLISARRAGRRSEYRLTAQGRRLFAAATRRIYGPAPPHWSGRWTLVLLPRISSARRERLREELRWLGYGILSGGVFAHPARSLNESRRELASLGVPSATVLQAQSAGRAADRDLVTAGWDLAQLRRAYLRFIRAFAPIRAQLRRPRRGRAAAELTPTAAYVVRILLIHEYRRIHLRDPLLPHDLLPPAWIGVAAEQLCRDLYRLVFSAAEEFIAAHGARLHSRLPPVSAQTYERFGGLAKRRSQAQS